jgi:hypothetical protein
LSFVIHDRQRFVTSKVPCESLDPAYRRGNHTGPSTNAFHTFIPSLCILDRWGSQN